MNLLLPPSVDSGPQVTLNNFKTAVFIGANGAGKTRLGIWLDQHNPTALRISAQKALNLPDNTLPIDLVRAEEMLHWGQTGDNKAWLEQFGKNQARWNGHPETHALNDFTHLITFLYSEEYDKIMAAKNSVPPNTPFSVPETKLDRLRAIWEHLLPHRKLLIRSGSLSTSIPNTEIAYPSSQMSDGERIIFYYIGEALSAKPNSLVIIDEPENHVHKAIQSKLWNEIESARQDCSFVYLTHDIDFAVSRIHAEKIWVRSFSNNAWDYVILNDEIDIPEDIYLEILGSRKNILFIEGEKSSLDHHLYREVFVEKTVEALGSSSKVINATKSFNDLRQKHRLTAMGLVDRDRRTDQEVSVLRGTGLIIANVAEVENFFLLEEVVKRIASSMHQDPNTVFNTVKSNVMSFFSNEMQRQIFEHAKHRLRKLAEKGFSSPAENLQDLDNSKTTLLETLDIPAILNEVSTHFSRLIEDQDYAGVLQVFNNKGIIARSDVTRLCNLATGGYQKYIFEEMKHETPTGIAIRAEIRTNIE